MSKIKTAIELVYGVKWQCKNCPEEKNYNENQEWQWHCSDTMRMIPWYKFQPIITKENMP